VRAPSSKRSPPKIVSKRQSASFIASDTGGDSTSDRSLAARRIEAEDDGRRHRGHVVGVHGLQAESRGQGKHWDQAGPTPQPGIKRAAENALNRSTSVGSAEEHPSESQ
jgi:hypothetical protein